MALIRTPAEAKAAVPRALSNLSNTANLPDFAAAEIKYLVPLIGYTLYDNINGAINAAPPEELGEANQAILPYLRRVVAYFSYLDDLGTDSVKITDGGLRSTESATMPRVVGWQYNELKNALQSKAFDAVEVLLRFLFENKNDYPEWVSSDEYSSLNGLLIKTGTDFDLHYKLHQPMRTYYSLKDLVDEVQEDFVKPAIGEDLLNYFIAADGLDDDEKKILKLLKKAVAYMVIKKACQHYSVRFDSNGFTILSAGGDGSNPDSAGRSDSFNAFHGGLFDLKIKSCEEDAQAYLNKAVIAMAKLRPGSGNEGFTAAYDAGPLVTYELSAQERDRKNDTRKGFRF